ncbi:MAG: D-2-hydroxyacid dehydrogenase [Planctomycetaceae bacterium]
MRLLCFPPLDDMRLTQVVAAAGDMEVVNAGDLPAAIHAIVDAEAFFGKLTPDLLRAANRLRWVQSPTASLEHYLFPELVEHSCLLSNMRGLFSDVVADHAIGMILCFARNLHIYRDRQRARRWEPVGGEAARTTFDTGPGQVSEIDRRHRHLADCVLGVVGVGGIGAEVCRRGSAFGMRVRGVDPLTRSVPGVVDDVWPLDRLDELLTLSDFVVIAAPHTPRTTRLFDAARLRRMRGDAFLINVGRGAIVDLRALTDALRAGQLAGAGLDVFEHEPLPVDHPLWGMEQAILTPHIAAASVRVPERHLQVLLENARRFAAGAEPINLVDKRAWF